MGWVTAFYLGHNLMANKFSEKAQAEMFADRPYVLLPITTAPTLTAKTVPGGFELKGFVPYGTCIMHADWAALGGIVEETGERRQFLLPIDDVVVDDVWHVAAMAGTGSNNIRVEEAFVPIHRSVPADDVFAGRTEGSAIHANPLYSIPILCFIWNETMCVFAGGLRGATEAFEDIMRERVLRYRSDPLRDQQLGHVLLGEAHLNTLAIESLTRDLANETLACLNAGTFTLEDRLRFKGMAAFIAERSRLAVQEMISHAGTSSFRLEQRLQRFLRDTSGLATHEFFSWDVGRELRGRHQLGLEPNHPLV